MHSSILENGALVNGSPSMIHQMFKKSNPSVQFQITKKRVLSITNSSMMHWWNWRIVFRQMMFWPFCGWFPLSPFFLLQFCLFVRIHKKPHFCIWVWRHSKMHPNPLNSLLSHTTIPMILLCGHDCSIAVHIGFNLLYFLFPLFRTKSHQKMSTMSKQLVVVSSLNILQFIFFSSKPVPVNSSHLPSLEWE